ncbi:MAG TPA: TPM domain-containing protein [Methylomusa anaerophila]|uniref:TPM domain-containing protein n=1 Tax=Methylomusa anaerophila TaxID=1930071 RepID=A0A348ALN2_9FIRM|nr:TPM domain-containing protein [Methylomusa anaerophila]BBB91980.1 hypothetical protein MAMMFC1_02665 [Methylomusa anaerophila]HML88007.1 TPM domain-containing protein [Methylomusa anaerophila]
MKKWLTWLILGAYLALAAVAFAQPDIPPAPASSIYAQDFAGVLSGETKSRINSLGSQLAAKTKAQVVVVTVKSLEGAALEDYALGILRQWGVGDKTLNNGVVMLVAVSDRQSRIEVGYGLEGALPDAKTGRIQDEYMIPHFQRGDYDQGILNGYQALVTETAKEYNLELKTDAKPVPTARTDSRESWWDTLPWWAQLAMIAGVLVLFMFDWLFLGGAITFLLLSLIRRGGGGGGGGGFGGGSGGGGGSSRKW